MSIDIREAMTDPALFGGQFGGESFTAWRALLSGFYGLCMGDDEAEHWQALTQRHEAPTGPHDELWLAVGRRGGKSQCAALLAVFEACFRDYSDRLSPGEVATVMVLAADRKQARSVFRYISGLLHSNPMLEALIVREDKESIELSSRTTIEVTTASFRAVRGYSVACCIADEVAFWRSEDSANPDYEIINAIRPAMATLDGRLIALSSPYAKRGELWEQYRRYFGQAGPVLVAQAPSWTMNPTLPARVVEQAYERDHAAAAAEYGAQFRTDIESFVSREQLDAVTRQGPLVRPFDRRFRYFGFVDPAGGGADEFTMAIGHHEDGVLVVDRLDARRGVPADITAEFAATLKEYGVSSVHLDRYGGSWPADELGRHGIKAEHSPQARSELYKDALQGINSEQVELPPCETMLHQWTGLERRTSRGGKDTIDHPPGAHDDRANATAGLIALHGHATRNIPLSEWV